MPATDLSGRVRFIFDRDLGGSYDSDQTTAAQTVTGNGGTKVYTLSYTPATTGQCYFALAVTTTLANNNTVLTDSWDWTQTVVRR